MYSKSIPVMKPFFMLYVGNCSMYIVTFLCKTCLLSSKNAIEGSEDAGIKVQMV